MNNKAKLFLATLFTATALGFTSGANAAILEDGNTAVCKGAGSCTLLSIQCSGNYTEGKDSRGTVYGECDKLNSAAQGRKHKFEIPVPQKKRTFRLNTRRPTKRSAAR